MSNFVFEVKNFRKMESPFIHSNLTRYVMYVNIKSMDKKLLEWFNTNPRSQNTKQNVSKEILKTLENNHENFHNLNKGILFSASVTSYYNKSDQVFVEFTDDNLHGNIDGGHTLKVILDYNDKRIKGGKELLDTYVFVEIITGIEDRDEIVELAAARNKSVQLDTKSIADLEKKFDSIKNLLQKVDANFEQRIIYKMNENKDQDSKKDIDVRDVIALLNMFNLDITKNDNNLEHPIKSYTSKESVLKDFLNLDKRENLSIHKSISKMEPIVKDIFELYDSIEVDFVYAYNNGVKNKYEKTFMPKKETRNRKNKLIRSKFGEKEMLYKVYNSFIYPLLGGFRSLVSFNEITQKFEWEANPHQVWAEKKIDLVDIIAGDENITSPNSIGKNKNIWSLIFSDISLYKTKLINNNKVINVIKYSEQV